jgi:hypothetical protein
VIDNNPDGADLTGEHQSIMELIISAVFKSVGMIITASGA